MRLSYLDSSRGLAALFVLLSHFQFTLLPQLNDSWILKTPVKIIADGQAAVLYFFILSGYVLTLSLQNQTELSAYNYIKFITKRIFRIFPAFIFTILVSYIVIISIDSRPSTWLDKFWNGDQSLFSVFKQSLLIVRFPNDPELRLIPQDWTLSIEIAVSFLLPALAVGIREKSFLSLFFVYFAVQYLGLDPFVFDFSLGVFLAINKNKAAGIWKKSGYKGVFVLISLILICSDYIYPGLMKATDVVLIHHKTWGLLILLLAIISSDNLQKVLSLKPLVFLGRISYSLYLLHLIILLIMTIYLPSLNAMVFLVVFVAITVFASSMTYYQIEKPFNRFGKLLFDK